MFAAAVMVFHLNAEMPAEAKLFFITGFLGALTTFSTFSAEIVHLSAGAVPPAPTFRRGAARLTRVNTLRLALG